MKTYLGDGVDVEMTGVGLKLTCNREGREHAIYLDVMEFCALLQFALDNGYREFIVEQLEKWGNK